MEENGAINLLRLPYRVSEARKGSRWGKSPGRREERQEVVYESRKRESNGWQDGWMVA